MFLWWQALYIQRLGVSIVSFEDVDLLGFTSNYAVIAPGRTSSDIIPSQLNIVFHLSANSLIFIRCEISESIAYIGGNVMGEWRYLSVPQSLDRLTKCLLATLKTKE